MARRDPPQQRLDALDAAAARHRCVLPRGRRPQQRLDALDAAAAGPPAERDAALAHALSLKTAIVVAHAAELTTRHDVAGTEPALRGALAAWLDTPADRDPGCRPKRALLEALYRLGDDHPEAVALYRRCVAAVQREAVWGGT